MCDYYNIILEHNWNVYSKLEIIFRNNLYKLGEKLVTDFLCQSLCCIYFLAGVQISAPNTVFSETQRLEDSKDVDERTSDRLPALTWTL